MDVWCTGVFWAMNVLVEVNVNAVSFCKVSSEGMLLIFKMQRPLSMAIFQG